MSRMRSKIISRKMSRTRSKMSGRIRIKMGEE